MRTATLFTLTLLAALAFVAPLASEARDRDWGHGDRGHHHGRNDHWGRHYGHNGWGHGNDWRRYPSRSRVNVNLFSSWDSAPVYYAPPRRPVIVRNVTWVNPRPSHRYTLLSSVVEDSPSSYCREYSANATIGGRTRQTYGTACLQPDGAWEIIN